MLAAAPVVTTQPAYVYLSRLVEEFGGVYPIAKIPTVAFPAADPVTLTALEAVADEFTSPEYVYLFRVVDAQGE